MNTGYSGWPLTLTDSMPGAQKTLRGCACEAGLRAPATFASSPPKEGMASEMILPFGHCPMKQIPSSRSPSSIARQGGGLSGVLRGFKRGRFRVQSK